MRILIIGAAGMIGRKLAHRLIDDGHLGSAPIEELVLCDAIEADKPVGSPQVVVDVADLSATGEADRLIAGRPDVIFHLAAIVSGEAEQDFERGYRINVDGTRSLLEAIRRADYCPRLVFTSSIAVFGAPFPNSIPDDYHCTPQTSYGTQKAICELLITDYTRKGFVDGYSLRLPTICVRPGKPNKAASGFFSSIIREPLNGQEAILPVSEDVLHWHASPRSAVGFLMHCAELDAQRVGPHRAITLPGVAVTVGEQIAALRKLAGQEVVNRIVKRPDPFVQNIVRNWPTRFDAKRGLGLGFQVENDFQQIIRAYMEDDMAPGHS